MGSENSALKSYTLEEPILTLPSGLSIFPATLQDGRLASVFVYQRGNEEKVNKAAKHLKTLRHPCLLRFLSCTVEADGIHLVTERVQPLELALETLTAEEICAGIYDILQALVFLHDRGKLTHNNVCLESIFVSESGHWKLGGMDTVCKFIEATPEFLQSILPVRDKGGIPPEDSTAEFKLPPEAFGHARDAYAFGTLVENLLTLLNESVSEDLMTSFQNTLQGGLLKTDPSSRPSLSTLLSHEFFRNDFLEVVHFLKTLTLKSEDEKSEFFKFLLDRVQSIPEELLVSRLVPQLLNPLVLAEPVAVTSFLPHLLRPKKGNTVETSSGCLLSQDLFQEHVLPLLVKLFQVHEEHVRMVLLTHIHAYADLFSPEELKTKILPQVLLGLRDASDTLVEMTLHSLAALVPLLGAQVVVGGERIKIFKRTTPSFTKSVDIISQGSPLHVSTDQRISFAQPMKNSHSPSSTTRKSLFGKKSIIEKNHPQAHAVPTSELKRNENVLPKSVDIISSKSMESISTAPNQISHPAGPTEEWPDWNEPEEGDEGKKVEIQIRSVEHDISANQKSDNGALDNEPWDDFEPYGDSSEVSSYSLPSTASDQVNTSQGSSLSHNSQDKKQSKALKLTSAPKRNPAEDVSKWNNDGWNQQTVPSQNISDKQGNGSKLKSGLGLGEEFAIEVKKKIVKDPELDLFADMVPHIKSSSTVLILPSERTERVVPTHENAVQKETCSETNDLSSRFAAAVDINDVEGEGWTEELNWEEDVNSW
ncbi:protein-associating with the carboxyl-terminal domain of ezrin isoform X2 [Protopterus annectens]|uniref:protein-associating with the carboxyl-terminal domain of ezrin isoform X2 n=1 Tax=Protopterus annectens TaxID=7888 RepID=UPI001CFA06F9|nr:protein-associating with the carboxyl-terminal domain of ezrin isoform X2 [Protopterus annectens]